MKHWIIEILRFDSIPDFPACSNASDYGYFIGIKKGCPPTIASGIKQSQDTLFGITRFSQVIMFPGRDIFPCSSRP